MTVGANPSCYQMGCLRKSRCHAYNARSEWGLEKFHDLIIATDFNPNNHLAAFAGKWEGDFCIKKKKKLILEYLESQTLGLAESEDCEPWKLSPSQRRNPGWPYSSYRLFDMEPGFGPEFINSIFFNSISTDLTIFSWCWIKVAVLTCGD